MNPGGRGACEGGRRTARKAAGRSARAGCLRSIEMDGLPARLDDLRPLIARAARKVIRQKRIPTYALSVAFVSDARMARLNRTGFGRRGTTDVISFDLSERGLAVRLVADIYISLDRARRQASAFGVSEREEILRLVLHGIFHAIGYEDVTESGEKEMEKVVEREVALLR